MKGIRWSDIGEFGPTSVVPLRPNQLAAVGYIFPQSEEGQRGILSSVRGRSAEVLQDLAANVHTELYGDLAGFVSACHRICI